MQRRTYELVARGKFGKRARRRGNGHWDYFDARNADNNGIAIDFMLNRGPSFADIRARIGAPAASSRNFRSLWNQTVPDPAPDWLAGRGIRRETLDACRLLIRRDSGGRVLCAHNDGNRRLTGFEIGPPDGQRRCATGGTRSLAETLRERLKVPPLVTFSA